MQTRPSVYILSPVGFCLRHCSTLCTSWGTASVRPRMMEDELEQLTQLGLCFETTTLALALVPVLWRSVWLSHSWRVRVVPRCPSRSAAVQVGSKMSTLEQTGSTQLCWFDSPNSTLTVIRLRSNSPYQRVTDPVELPYSHTFPHFPPDYCKSWIQSETLYSGCVSPFPLQHPVIDALQRKWPFLPRDSFVTLGALGAAVVSN